MADEQPPLASSNSAPELHADANRQDASTEALSAQTPEPTAADDPLAQVLDSATEASDQAAIDALLSQAAFDDPSSLVDEAAMPDAAALALPSFQQVMRDAQVSSIDLLRDVELNVKIELGRSRMLVEDVLKLGEGSVVELDKLAGDPVDVFVNDRLVARGEVLVLNDNFCVRVNEIVAAVKEEGV
jgi:flagellar motor switch protein FliN